MLLIDILNDDNHIWKFYALAKSDEDCELFDFLGSLSAKDQESWSGLVAIMEQMAVAPEGPNLLALSHEMGSSKHKIYRFEKGRLRIAWFYGEGNKIVICSHGYYKRTQKTPEKEIKKAERNYKAYCEMEKKKR
jgi:hypothetical protein